MPTGTDAFGLYKVGPGGEKEYFPPNEYQIDGEYLFRYDSKNNILELAADSEKIDSIRATLEEENEFKIYIFTGEAITFKNLKDIKILPNLDGGYTLIPDDREK